MNSNNLSIVRQQFAQCVFNHKVQEKAAERTEKAVEKIKYANVAILSFVLVFLLLQVRFKEISIFGDISIAITVFEILFLYIQKEFSFDKKSSEHKKVALKYLELRDKYKNFIVDIANNLSKEQISAKRDLLQEQYQIISDLSMQTKCCDYAKAQFSLLGKNNSDEEFTWSDREIDLFLPSDLRFNK